MTGNSGKFIDRSPIICAAGLSKDDPEYVANTLKEFNVVDEITALKHDAHIWKDDEFILPRQLPPLQNKSFVGTNTEIKPLLNPPVKTRYQQLILDLKETPYSSYWYQEVGKVRDPVPGLPAGTDRYTFTCGSGSVKDVPVKELVNPPKSHYEVLQESQIGHDMYKWTHNDYNPSEQVSRGYFSPPFDPHRCYGAKTKYDPRGVWMKCATDWYKKEPIVMANKVQSDYLNRVRPKIGKPLAPNKNIKCVPEGFTFGSRSAREFYGVEDLLKDPEVNPSVFHRDFQQWMSALNKLRLKLKERANNLEFNFDDFRKQILNADKEKNNSVPLDIFYEICICNKVIFCKDDIEPLLVHLKIIGNGNLINYKKFIDLVNVNKEMVDLRLENDIPKGHRYFVTTQQAAACDYTIIDNSELPTAGVPGVRHDLERPIKPEGGCRADIDNLGSETTAKTVLNPSIFASYGLSFRDFYLPREPQVIRHLFEKIGYTFPDNTFSKLWQLGLEQDKTGLVCVQTFRDLLEQHRQSKYGQWRVDEREIECAK